MSLSPFDPHAGRRRRHDYWPSRTRAIVCLLSLSIIFAASFGIGTALAAPGDSCKNKRCLDNVKIELREKWRKEVRESGYAGWLKNLRGCEARGWKNPYKAINPSGKYRGAYQFDGPTWREAGGRGHVQSLWGQPWADPAEQDVRTVRLAKKVGKGRWPECG